MPREATTELESDDEPAVLGAAPTSAVERRSRRGTARRRGKPRPVAPGPATTPAPPVPADDGQVVQVYEPHSGTMPPLREYVTELWRRREFMWELARADVRGKSSSTVLGGLWSLLDPLFQAAIYYMLFTIIREGGRPVDFLHVLVACLFLFQLATGALTEGAGSVRRSKSLMLNSTFPRALLPATAICKGLLEFVPTIGVYALLHVALGAPVHVGLLLLPLLLVLQVVMMAGIALLTSTLVVFVRDAQNLLQYITRLLFFTSPVIYPLALLPDGIRSILAWQPLFPLFASYQHILSGSTPDLSLILQTAGWAIAFLVVGGQLFLRHERRFALHL